MCCLLLVKYRLLFAIGRLFVVCCALCVVYGLLVMYC